MSDIPNGHDCSADSPQHTLQQQIEKAQPCSMMKHECGSGDNAEKPPLYLPQPEDEYPPKPGHTMEPIGPWATGKVTCSREGGITGLRPVADRYSITRYGPSEWRAHNLSIFQQSNKRICDAQVAADRAKQCVDQVYTTADKVQSETTEHLKTRANVVYRWKAELEHAIAAIAEEMELLETERRRVQRSLSILTIPLSIANEFLQLRSFRLNSDLVRDNVEEQLTKEIALCTEIRDLLRRTYEQIEIQMVELKSAKARAENDWSDKIHTYNLDSVCVNLSNDSPLLLWKAGATRFPADQSTPTSYDHFTQEVLTDSEAAKQRSIKLRSTLNDIYTNSIKDLRDQATRVDVALANNVELTQDCLQQLENELLRCLHELANTEKLIETLRGSTKGLNNGMKLAQTRLDNRLNRLNVESCRDAPQFALIEEVKSLGEHTSAVLAELKRAEEVQAELVKAREMKRMQNSVRHNPVQEAVDIAQEEEEKKNVNLEVLDDVEETAQQPLYQIRPHLDEKFKPLSAKEIIHDVLFEQLATKSYDAQAAAQWTKDIADVIERKIKDLQFKRYKYIVNVVLGQQHGAGVKIGTRCIWDAEADTYAYDSFINDTIFCVAIVYAVYFY
ncbi:PREDICTED: tektin-4 [Trachymyrmex cornetzi]|uniref:tektin-4 n=1 Tax=Trachymyrmex cornetzi TaxID=471704 RepID=UPI00084ED871|nr:PREDICTED: tektin-4 [Trachymyrmex cornetzi]